MPCLILLKDSLRKSSADYLFPCTRVRRYAIITQFNDMCDLRVNAAPRTAAAVGNKSGLENHDKKTLQVRCPPRI